MEQLSEAESARGRAFRDMKELEQLNKGVAEQLKVSQLKCKDMEEWIARADQDASIGRDQSSRGERARAQSLDVVS